MHAVALGDEEAVVCGVVNDTHACAVASLVDGPLFLGGGRVISMLSSEKRRLELYSILFRVTLTH